MKVLCILLCIAFASGFYKDNNEIYEEKIVGGGYVRIEDVPYQATLFSFRVNDFCGATIIHQSWVITAAHCVFNKSHITVRTGTGHRIASGKFHVNEKIIMHRGYDSDSKNNDIALIKLAEPLQFNAEQQPIEIAKPHDIPRQGDLMRISGFGTIGKNLKKPDVLKAAYVPVVNQENCRRPSMLHPITANMFCAGNGAADPCYGDFGGPGVIHDKLYGIISFGTDCNSRVFPGVFTRMHKYHDWIEEKTGLRF